MDLTKWVIQYRVGISFSAEQPVLDRGSLLVLMLSFLAIIHCYVKSDCNTSITYLQQFIQSFNDPIQFLKVALQVIYNNLYSTSRPLLQLCDNLNMLAQHCWVAPFLYKHNQSLLTQQTCLQLFRVMIYIYIYTHTTMQLTKLNFKGTWTVNEIGDSDSNCGYVHQDLES